MRFDAIKRGLLQLAEQAEDIKAIIEIGSQARTYERADEYSDLDLLLVTDMPEEYLERDDRLAKVGTIKISFVEPTLGGALERRILFEGALDVDLVVFTQAQCEDMLLNHVADGILERGYVILYDVMNFAEKSKAIKSVSSTINSHNGTWKISEREYINMVNDFWYHTVWTTKKIARGEIWTAKMCIDSYMKVQLLRMMEFYHKSLYGEAYDVWHDGRFLEKWADEIIVNKLRACFSRYDKKEIAQAVIQTAALFGEMAKVCAEKNKYAYPVEAEEYARFVISQSEDE